MLLQKALFHFFMTNIPLCVCLYTMYATFSLSIHMLMGI